MARPKKIGIDYFPLDVDMFEDEKILPALIANQHAENIIIRLMCALYRNGYYIDYNQNLKTNIAYKGRIQIDDVDRVVQALLDSGFFNHKLFLEHGILTSKGIQSRWKIAVRKRVMDDGPEYWLLNETSGKKAEETPKKAEETPKKTEAKPPKPKKVQPDALQIPFMSAEFINAWKDLIALPKWKKKPPSALQASLNQLSKYNESFAIRLIEKAIAGNYQGVVFSNTDEEFHKYVQSPAPTRTGKIIINTPVKEIEGWK